MKELMVEAEAHINLKKYYREKAIQSLKEHLTSQEWDILDLRIGFNDKKHTFQEIADKYKISRERVRQIYNKTIKKINSLLERRKELKRLLLFR